MRKSFLVAAFVLATVEVLAFPAIPKESAKALGITRGRSFSSGIVFVNGKYLPPPYVVERWGTGIRINKIPVTGQIISWNEFLKTQKNVRVEEATPAAESPRSAEPSAPAPVSVPAPAADEGDEGKENAPASSHSTLDDLFGTAKPVRGSLVITDRAVAAPSDFGSVTEVNGRRVSKLSEARRWSQEDQEDSGDEDSGDDDRGQEDGDGEGEPVRPDRDDGQSDGSDSSDRVREDEGNHDSVIESEPPVMPETETTPKSAPAMPKNSSLPKAKARLILDGPFVKNAASQALVSKINTQRSEIDCALRSGGFICFGDGYARISGDRQSADHLLSVLPEIQMKSESLSAFCHAVRKAQLLYLHELVCRDLFANRIDYRILQERRTKVRKDREWRRLIEGDPSLF